MKRNPVTFRNAFLGILVLLTFPVWAACGIIFFLFSALCYAGFYATEYYQEKWGDK